MFKAQAIILAGGQGSRLRPYTTILPKPLLPVGDVPIVEVIIYQLKKYRFRNIVISTGHLAGLIEAYFGSGRKWGVNIQYVYENKALGTAGAIKLVKSIEENCLIINGDVLTDMNFTELLSFHGKRKAMATITVKKRIVKTDFGVIEFDGNHSLTDYIEKPEHTSYVSIGVNVINKACKRFIKHNEYIGMPELMLRMKADNQRVVCFKTKAQWLDLGRPDDFETAQELFYKQRRKFLG